MTLTVKDRVVSGVLSTSAVARDGHTIATSGWDLANYKTNPVLLWSHDCSQPAIGRAAAIGTSGDELKATYRFPDEGVYPLADTVYDLLEGGFLNAFSVSWNPTEWRYATAKGRAPGAIDFLKQELLEVSIVNVPALTQALVTARSFGIDTAPLGVWAASALNGSIPDDTNASELRRLYDAAMAGPNRRSSSIVPACGIKAQLQAAGLL